MNVDQFIIDNFIPKELIVTNEPCKVTQKKLPEFGLFNPVKKERKEASGNFFLSWDKVIKEMKWEK